MGVTIHYSGHLKEPSAYLLLLDALQDFAGQHGWSHRPISQQGVTLNRWDDSDREWTVTGDTRGIELRLHDDCEPVAFEFDADHFMQDHVKTQYAPPEIHISITELFRHLLPFFSDLDVFDEGEYWESRDPDRLNELFNDCFQALHAALAENPNARGPVHIGEGRIADIIE